MTGGTSDADGSSGWPSLAETASRELKSIAAKGLLRRLRRLEGEVGSELTHEGRALLNFSSNDYLGLAASADLKAAMAEAVDRFGTGSGAARLVSGSLAPHHHLEETLAEWKGVEAAITFSSGYATALGVIPAVIGKGDTVVLDKLSHASLIDAAKLSGADLRVFPHNNTHRLEEILTAIRAKDSSRKILVVTESIFSMDGDAAPLPEIVRIKDNHGAWLLVDEAHAVGVLGPEGKGLIAQLGLTPDVELQMGTLGKALGVSGGYLAAARPVVDLLVNRARSFIFSTAPPPAVAAAAGAAVHLVKGGEGEKRRALLERNRSLLHDSALQSFRLPPPAAIYPIIIGGEDEALQAAAFCSGEGVFIPAIRFPTVARGAARLRLTLSASHEPFQIERLVACLHAMTQQVGITPLLSAQEVSQETVPEA